jgi:hypothetical protein
MGASFTGRVMLVVSSEIVVLMLASCVAGMDRRPIFSCSTGCKEFPFHIGFQPWIYVVSALTAMAISLFTVSVLAWQGRPGPIRPRPFTTSRTLFRREMTFTGDSFQVFGSIDPRDGKVGQCLFGLRIPCSIQRNCSSISACSRGEAGNFTTFSSTSLRDKHTGPCVCSNQVNPDLVSPLI